MSTKTSQLALAFTCMLAASTSNAAEILTNGGFETGNFSGWTATTNGLGELTPWAVGGSGGGYFGNTSPLSGSFDAYNGFDGDAGLVYELYQDVVIPSASVATLSTNHRIVFDSLGISSTLDRIFEISIRDLSNALLANLYSESITMNGAGFTDLGWNNQVFDVSAYSGSTVRVHFREFIPETYTGPANLELDNLSLTAVAAVPEPTTFALLGLGFAGIAFSRRKRA